jgi:hypothetical protein
MNTGLQDAYNLGWKLALAATGRADEELLASYENERVPIAERLLNTTDRAFSLIVSDRWISRFLRTRVLARIVSLVMRFKRARRLVFRVISQIGIAYRQSSLSETAAGFLANAPRAGDRFPDLHLLFRAGKSAEDLFSRMDDRYFNLIVVGQTDVSVGAPALRDLVRVHGVAVDSSNQHDADLLTRYFERLGLVIR